MKCKLVLDPTGWIGVTWIEGEAEIKHVSYHPAQIDMLRTDSAEMGVSLEEHEQMLADWVAAYVPPEPEPISIPQVVTRRQARRALALFGLLDAVQAALDAIPDPMQRAIAQIDWDDATEFNRDDETLQMLSGALGLTDSQLDDLFILAGEQP